MLHKLSFYKTAADLLKLVKESGKNVKNILYSERKYKFMNIKALYALVTEALKHWPVLELLINGSKILIKEPTINIWHVRILVTELLFGKKELDCEHEFVQTLLKYEKKFRKILSKEDTQNLMLNLPKPNVVGVKVRYIKVNTIVCDVETVINTFNNEGWEQLKQCDSYQDYLNQLRNLEPNSHMFLQDFHISQVLAFPPGTEFHEHELYKNGSFHLMDKSSCLAPYLLQPHPHASVLDMCAAPGLKTIHLASLVPSGKVHAVERDANRYKTLQEMVTNSGAENVVTVQDDVTRLELDKYKDVEYILLDPSCSGSGMRDRQPRDNGEGGEDVDRLYRLQSFQLTLLRFALTRFPAAKRVVYSTCSVNVEENEEVVLLALNSKYHDFDVVSVEKKLPGWTSFGSNRFNFGSKCVYSLPECDFTNGFFLAVFERKNSYSNDEIEPLIQNRHEFDQESDFVGGSSSYKEEKYFTQGETNQDFVIERKNSHSKDNAKKKLKMNQESQNNITKIRKHSKACNEMTSFENNELSEKRSFSETVSSGDNNNDYPNKKRKKEKSVPAVLNGDSKNKQPKEVSGNQQAGLHTGKTSKKPTKSQKKRMRKIKIKSKLSHKTDTNKKKDQAVKNIKKKIKNEKSVKVLKNTEIKDDIKNKISQSKLRHLRLKKLKLLKNKLVESSGEKSPKHGKKLIKKVKSDILDSEEKNKTKHKKHKE